MSKHILPMELIQYFLENLFCLYIHTAIGQWLEDKSDFTQKGNTYSW